MADTTATDNEVVDTSTNENLRQQMISRLRLKTVKALRQKKQKRPDQMTRS